MPRRESRPWRPIRPSESRAAGRSVEVTDGSVAIAAITSCTNTSNPTVMVAGRPAGPEMPWPRLTAPPTVKDQLAPGSRARHRVPAGREPAGASRKARLRPRRLRLHDLHRQQRSAGRSRGGCDPGERPSSLGRALGQPQLRRPHSSPCPGELPGLAAAGRSLRACRHRGYRPHNPAARNGQGRRAVFMSGRLALGPGGPHHRRLGGQRRAIPDRLRLGPSTSGRVEGARRGLGRFVPLGGPNRPTSPLRRFFVGP